jgi:DNA-binding NarL/FixJ family response regulator
LVQAQKYYIYIRGAIGRVKGGSLMVSRAKNLFPHIKRRLLDLGFPNVDITSEEKDSLNLVINEKKPDLVLVGSGFYQAATPYMMGELLGRFPKLNIAAVSVYEYPDVIAAWFIWHGVKSYLNLWEGYEEFHRGLQEVRKGKVYVSRNVRCLMDLFSEWPKVGDKATKRQMETLVLICNGFIPKQIGDAMHITRRTVSNHLKDLYQIFHVKNREEMVSLAWELDLVCKEDMRFIDRREKNKPLPEWAAARQKMNRRIMKDDH